MVPYFQAPELNSHRRYGMKLVVTGTFSRQPTFAAVQEPRATIDLKHQTRLQRNRLVLDKPCFPDTQALQRHLPIQAMQQGWMGYAKLTFVESCSTKNLPSVI